MASLIMLPVKIHFGFEFGYIWIGSFWAGGTLLLTSHSIRMIDTGYRYYERRFRPLVSCPLSWPIICFGTGLMCEILTAAFALGLALELDSPEWFGDKVWWGFFIAYAIASFFEPLAIYAAIELEPAMIELAQNGSSSSCYPLWWGLFFILALGECGSMVLLAFDLNQIADFDILALGIKIGVAVIVTLTLIGRIVPCNCRMTVYGSLPANGSKHAIP